MSETITVDHMGPKITIEALNNLYGANLAVISEARYAKQVKRFLDGFAVTIVLTSDGLLVSYPEYKKGVPSEVKAMKGYPAGLKLFVANNQTNKHIQAIVNYCEKQELHEVPSFISDFGPFSWKLKQKLSSFLLEICAATQNEKAKLQGAFSNLRLTHEHTLRRLDKLERVTTGLGYDGFSMIYEAPYGKRTIGPDATDADTEGLVQHLPADIASLYAIELYIANIPTEKCELEYTIRRIADGLVACSFTVSSSDMVMGWNLFELPYVSDDLVGEANLEIKWKATGSQNILFALSDQKASRFGLQMTADPMGDIRDTLALRLWQGNTICAAVNYVPRDDLKDEDRGAPVQLSPIEDGSSSPAMNRRTMQVYKFAELAPRVEFVHGEEKHKQIFYDLDFWPLMLNEDLGYIQTHPLIGELSGAVLYGAAPEGSRNIRAQVRTAHAGAPKLLYILARLPASKSRNDTLDVEAVKRALQGAADVDKTCRANGFDEETGIVWSSLGLLADTPGVISLKIDETIDGTGDLLFATMPIDNDVSCGWCRWYSLYVDTNIKNPVPAKSVDHSADMASIV
jgi:hypothetical protein